MNKIALFFFLTLIKILANGCGTQAENQIRNSKIHLFYKDDIPEKLAETFSQLMAAHWPGNYREKVHMLRMPGGYEFQIVVPAGLESDEKWIQKFRYLGIIISTELLQGEKVQIRLCPADLSAGYLLPPGSFGSRLLKEGVSFFFTPGISSKEITGFTELITQAKIVGKLHCSSVMLAKTLDTYECKVILPKETKLTAEQLDELKYLAGHMSEKLFRKMKTEIHVCATGFETLLILSMPDN